MRKLLYILLLLGSIVQAQFSPMIGIVASQVEGENKAYVFNGNTTSYFTSDFDLNSLTASFSFVIEFSTTNGASTKYMMFGRGNTSDASYIRLDAAELFKAQFDASGGGYISNIQTTDATLIDGTLRQVVVTYDDTTNTIAWYSNGTFKASEVDEFVGWFTADTFLEIGGTYVTDAPWIGKMYTFQVYSKTLNQTEITALASDITDTATNLVANFSSNKSTNWTDEVSGYIATNEGGVSLE